METTAADRLADHLMALYEELRDDEKALLLVVLSEAGGIEVEGYDLNNGLTMIPNILQMQHESKKAVIQNLRA